MRRGEGASRIVAIRALLERACAVCGGRLVEVTLEQYGAHVVCTAHEGIAAWHARFESGVTPG